MTFATSLNLGRPTYCLTQLLRHRLITFNESLKSAASADSFMAQRVVAASAPRLRIEIRDQAIDTADTRLRSVPLWAEEGHCWLLGWRLSGALEELNPEKRSQL